ncbi:DUF1127 domain-containing protein [Pseudomonas sp. IT-P176]
MERRHTVVRVGRGAMEATLDRSVQHLYRALAQLGRWRQLSRDRAELARMSDDRLRDIGLSRADVVRESSRPFWDDPLKR